MSSSPGGADPKSAAQSLFTFLDECDADAAVDENRPPLRPTTSAAAAACETVTPKLQAENAISKVKCQLVDMKLAEKRDRHRIATLEASLAQAQQQTEAAVRTAQAELQGRLHDQKIEYDRALQRQLQFVDQLLADKKALTEKVEVQVALAEQIRNAAAADARDKDQAWNRRVEKLRREWEESERARRTVWASEKQEIIRARLLNEFQKAGDSRTSRITRELTDRHDKELAAVRAACERDTVTRIAAARAALQAEFDERLRQLESERLDELKRVLAQQQANVVAQRQELSAQFEAERRSWEKDREREVAELRAAIEAERRNVSAVREQHREDLEQVRRKAGLELGKHRDRLQAQAEAQRSDWLREAEAQLREKERVFRDRIVAERDAQIETIVERLSVEATEKETRLEKTRRSEIETLSKQLERTEAAWKERYDQLLIKFRDACERAEDGKKAAAEARDDRQLLLRRKDEAEAAVAKLEAAREVDREQCAQQLDQARADAAKAVGEAVAAEKAARHALELAQEQFDRQLREAESRRDDEMAQVEGKVRAAMSRKEATIGTLRGQLESKEMQLEQMRRTLDRYKRDLLGL